MLEPVPGAVEEVWGAETRGTLAEGCEVPCTLALVFLLGAALVPCVLAFWAVVQVWRPQPVFGFSLAARDRLGGAVGSGLGPTHLKGLARATTGSKEGDRGGGFSEVFLHP